VPGETDVVNYGLRLVGASPITSLGDGTSSANAADDIYTELRDDLLRSHPWNFCTKRVKLAKSATAPTFEFDNAFPLPADWIGNVSVHNNDAGHGTFLYRVELVNNQRSIVTSADEVWVRYTFRVTDPNLMASDFRMALALALGRDLAVPLASSNSLSALLGERHEKKLASARSKDALGSFPELRPTGSWVTSRGGRRTNSLIND
jgi:hypothetical protein